MTGTTWTPDPGMTGTNQALDAMMIPKMASETIVTDNFAEEVEELRMTKALSDL